VSEATNTLLSIAYDSLFYETAIIKTKEREERLLHALIKAILLQVYSLKCI